MYVHLTCIHVYIFMAVKIRRCVLQETVFGCSKNFQSHFILNTNKKCYNVK